MNTKILMIISSLLMAACGVVFQLAPHGTLRFVGAEADGIVPLLVQIVGAGYLGFAMMNWMAKTVLIGGIYARPLAMGNFLHFTIGALGLLKFAFSVPDLISIWIAAIIYSIFAILFGFVFFAHPPKVKTPNKK